MDQISGLIDWVNTFEHSQPVSSPNDLSDGLALFEIMAEIDPDRFKVSSIKTETGSWVLKEGNLKRLHKLILDHYEENLNQDSKTFDSVDLKLIAKESNETELVKLVQLVLGCVIQCENNQQYIERITTLEEAAQGVLMIMIQEIMSKVDQRSNSVDHRRHSFGETEALRAEVDDLSEKKRKLESENEKLKKNLDNARAEADDYARENEELTKKLHLAEEKIERIEALEKAEEDLKHKLEQRYEELKQSEGQREVVWEQNREKEREIQKLKSENESLNAQYRELESRRAEEVKALSAKLEKAETAIEKYKTKIEEISELKKQLKEIQSERDAHLNKIKDLEDSASKSSSTKTQLTGLKEAIRKLESEKMDLILLQGTMERELEKARGETEKFLSLSSKLEEDNRLLNQKIEELQFGGRGSTEEEGSGVSKEILQKETEELRLKVLRLESENQRLRGASDPEEKESALNELLQETQHAKNQLEQRLKEESQKSHKLADQLKLVETKLQEAETKLIGTDFRSNEASLALEQLAMAEREAKSFQMKSEEIERELKEVQRKLRATEEALQEKQKEALSLKSELQLTSKDKLEMMEGYKAQVEQEISEKISKTERSLAERTSELEDAQRVISGLETSISELKESIKSLEESNKDQLIKMNALQSQNLALLEKHLQATEGKGKESDESITRKLEIAAQKIIQIQEEKESLVKALKKAKTYIEIQEKKIKELNQKLLEIPATPERSAQENFPEAITTLQKDLSTLKSENERLLGQIKDLKNDREALKKEQRLVVSTWYNLGLQMKKSSTTKKASWLGQQREGKALNLVQDKSQIRN